MGRIKVKAHMVDILFALALFGLFAASALIVSIIGARVYRNTVENMHKNFDTRGSVTYVTTKMRQGDENGLITLTEFDEMPALLLEQIIEDVTYQTWIYHHEGALKEIFTEKGTEIEPYSGTVILEVETFSITREAEKLYRVSASDRSGGLVETLVSTRT